MAKGSVSRELGRGMSGETFEDVVASYDDRVWLGRDVVRDAMKRLTRAHNREVAAARREARTLVYGVLGTPVYDVLGNERHKAVCALRKMSLDTGGAVKKLAIALGIKWDSANAERSTELLKERIIHLLGGDQSTLSDIWGLWKDTPIEREDAKRSRREEKMSDKITLKIRPFLMGTEKESAIKVLEEASEVRAAWQEFDGCGSPEQCGDQSEALDVCYARVELADEIADCIQACVNLADRYGIDLQAAMNRCHERNHMRGRC